MALEASTTGRTGVNVELNVGGRNGTNIELSGNERLEASVGGETIRLTQDTDLFDVDYEGTLNTSTSNDPYRISFFREDAGNNLELIASTSCTTNTGSNRASVDFFTISDDGAEDFSLNRLSVANDNTIDRNRNCDLSFTLERVQNGTLDVRFEEGGQITATQSREVDDLTLNF